jgi:hypothetical protein
MGTSPVTSAAPLVPSKRWRRGGKVEIEKRGKYPGVKVHLDPEECEVFMKLADDAGLMGGAKVWSPYTGSYSVKPPPTYLSLATKLGRKINALKAEFPTLLKERTQEEIEEVLRMEKESATKKLDALAHGSDWKQFSSHNKKGK